MELILCLMALAVKALLTVLLSLTRWRAKVRKQLVVGKDRAREATLGRLVCAMRVVPLEQVLHLVLVSLQVVRLALIELLLQRPALRRQAPRIPGIGGKGTRPVVHDLALGGLAQVEPCRPVVLLQLGRRRQLLRQHADHVAVGGDANVALW